MLNKSLILLTLSASLVYSQCPSIRTRYECRELPEATKSNLFAAIKKLTGTAKYTQLVDDHVAVTSSAHGTPEFFPWHREYLYRFEQALGVDMCYWDWATDAQAPEVSIVNAPNWFGTDGGGGCIKDSYFGQLSYQGECVSSQWDGGSGKIGAFYSIDYVSKIITDAKTYEEFRVPYEGTAHARIHNGIGAMFSKMMSPANPVFFAHHANVDRHWAIWQWVHSNDNPKDYPKDLSSTVPVYDVTVNQLMNTKSAPYCYSYSNMDIINHGRSKAGLNRRAMLSRRMVPSSPILERRSDSLPAPCPSKCGQIDEASGYQYPPCDDDRKDLTGLRTVKPIPEWWCKMNNINVTVVRKYESEHQEYIRKLNQLPGYVSPSALYNRPKLLEELVKRGESEFYIVDEKFKKQVLPCVKKLIEQPEKAVETLRQAVESVYKVLDYDKIKDGLKNVVGEDLANSLVDFGKRFANHPYNPPKPAPVPAQEDDEEEYCDVDDNDEDDEDDSNYDAY